MMTDDDDTTAARACLDEEARTAVARALGRRRSYGVRMLLCPGERPRVLVVAGETHIKLRAAAALGQDLVRAFALRGVEGFQRDRVLAGRALGVLIEAPRRVLRALSLGAVKGSTITDARAVPAGHTFALESASETPFGLHVGALYLTVFFSVTFGLWITLPLAHVVPPLGAVAAWLGVAALALEVHSVALVPAIALRRQPWSWVLHPALAILTLRDRIMAEGTVAMLRAHPEPAAALAIMGRAHLPGYTRELVERYGFRVLDPEAVLRDPS
jgi:hypothetical protein